MEFRNFDEFWRFYLGEHSKPWTRWFHFVGSSLGLVLFVVALIQRNPVLIIYALFVGYLFAWISHFLIERNKPATFRYPLRSFICDWRMWYCMLTRSKF